MISKSVNFFGVFILLLLLEKCSFTFGLPNFTVPQHTGFVHLRYIIFEKDNSLQIKTFDGAAIAEKWIITVAKEIINYGDKTLEVGVGVANYITYDTDIAVQTKHCHEKYNEEKMKNMYYNIALLEIDKKINPNTIVYLPHKNHHVAHNREVYLYGFGEFSGTSSHQLLMSNLKTKKRKTFENIIDTVLIGKGNIRAGEEGSPIYYFSKKCNKRQLVAITSTCIGQVCSISEYLIAVEVTHPDIVQFVDDKTGGDVQYGS